MTNRIRIGRREPIWRVFFEKNKAALPEGDALGLFRAYTYARLTNYHDLPAVALVHFPKGKAGRFGKVRDTLDLKEYIMLRYGVSMGPILTLKSDIAPNFVITRKGDTYRAINEVGIFGPRIEHRGIFSFFEDEEDYVLAQLFLGHDRINSASDLRGYVREYEELTENVSLGTSDEMLDLETLLNG